MFKRECTHLHVLRLPDRSKRTGIHLVKFYFIVVSIGKVRQIETDYRTQGLRSENVQILQTIVHRHSGKDAEKTEDMVAVNVAYENGLDF